MLEIEVVYGAMKIQSIAYGFLYTQTLEPDTLGLKWDLPPNNYVNLDKLNLHLPQFPYLKRGIIIEPNSQSCLRLKRLE